MELAWILGAGLVGGVLSCTLAAFALLVRAAWVPTLVSYAIGALLGAAFLEVIPHAFEHGNARQAGLAILGGIVAFFVLEKLLLWRHCHTENCEAHDPHAAAHAGWRGLQRGVLPATVAALGVDPSRLIAWFGPAIGANVYEVGSEVRDAFLARGEAYARVFRATRPGHWLFDLVMAARLELVAAGVQRVYGGDLCVHSDAQRFFSFRRDGATGRMAALIWLEGERCDKA